MFKGLIRRNLIATIIPVIVMEVLVIFMTIQLGLLDEYRCYSVGAGDDLGIMYLEGRKNICMSVSGPLEYAGYDVVSDKGKLGTYYYRFDGKSIQLFVLKDETMRKINSGSDIQLYAKLIEDKVTSSYIENGYNDEAGMGEGVFDGFVNPLIINELEYPVIKVDGIKIMGVTAKVLVILTVLYMILAYIFPVISFGYSKRGLFRSRSEMIEALNQEADEKLEEKNGSEIITENYVIYAYLSHLDVIKREKK